MSTDVYPAEPVVPLGTKVRAHPAGWEEIQADSYEASFEQGLDILPEGQGMPEWVEGPLEGGLVTSSTRPYFQHIVGGWMVEPSSIETI